MPPSKCNGNGDGSSRWHEPLERPDPRALEDHGPVRCNSPGAPDLTPFPSVESRARRGQNAPETASSPASPLSSQNGRVPRRNKARDGLTRKRAMATGSRGWGHIGALTASRRSGTRVEVMRCPQRSCVARNRALSSTSIAATYVRPGTWATHGATIRSDRCCGADRLRSWMLYGVRVGSRGCGPPGAGGECAQDRPLRWRAFSN